MRLVADENFPLPTIEALREAFLAAVRFPRSEPAELN